MHCSPPSTPARDHTSPQISAYEHEMAQLREQLLREISHLEAQKEEAVKEASECSEQHLDQLRQQFAGTGGQVRGQGCAVGPGHI